MLPAGNRVAGTTLIREQLDSLLVEGAERGEDWHHGPRVEALRSSTPTTLSPARGADIGGTTEHRCQELPIGCCQDRARPPRTCNRRALSRGGRGRRGTSAPRRRAPGIPDHSRNLNRQSVERHLRRPRSHRHPSRAGRRTSLQPIGSLHRVRGSCCRCEPRPHKSGTAAEEPPAARCGSGRRGMRRGRWLSMRSGDGCHLSPRWPSSNTRPRPPQAQVAAGPQEDAVALRRDLAARADGARGRHQIPEQRRHEPSGPARDRHAPAPGRRPALRGVQSGPVPHGHRPNRGRDQTPSDDRQECDSRIARDAERPRGEG